MRGLRLEPERVRVTTRGEVLVTIHGQGFGRLRVGGERRWVSGRFSQSFVLSKRERSVAIEARWLFGRQSFSLALEPGFDVRAPRLTPAAFRDPADSERAAVAAPRVRAPRFLPLSIPREIALRVRRRLLAFERSGAIAVERDTGA
jgi:hypothetical protein